ncbi:MAG: shikimate kinase [Alphaproteobacteria bacterium HGW-Alphaproteobacteria-2]|nr:MAG: shikimate kinase [Alphaproteobacteria bacterium HGW-Alphaproteobacteria-2]
MTTENPLPARGRAPKTAPRGDAWQLMRPVVLVGMPGCGKSAVGAALARRLCAPFRDSDAEIVAAANLGIAEIFDRWGEDFFREKEAQVLARLLEGAPCVLSTGGGAFLRPGNRALIAERGIAVWLKADLELLWERVRRKETRPLLRVPDPRARLAELYDERVPVYAQAGLTVESEAGVSVATMAARVARALAEHPGGVLVQKAKDEA